MEKKSKNTQNPWPVCLVVLCMVVIFAGGIWYVTSLRDDLIDQAIRNVMTVTTQQQQAFDNFIAGDQERLHSFAEYFSRNVHNDPKEIQQQLTLFNEVDAVYSVICLDEGWFCNNVSDDIRQLDRERLDVYRSLEGRGVRDSYIGLLSGDLMFGYYEAFSFANGHRGLIQKSYDRSKVSRTFSLSFYDDEGMAYVVNRKGDILLRSMGLMGTHAYDNVFDVLTGTHGEQEDIDAFVSALEEQRSGSMVFTGGQGEFVYTYVPIETVEEWYLVSVVRMSAIWEESNKIVMNSRMSVAFLGIIVSCCVAFVLLLWNNRRQIVEKNRVIEYQEQLFDIFATYLANNTNDVYLMMDIKSREADYVSPNVERVLGVPEADVLNDLAHSGMSAYFSEAELSDAQLGAMKPGTALNFVKSERINPKTGKRQWFQESVYCTLVQGRRKLVVYISDRTEETKIQNDLSETLQMAQVANRAKSAFLGSVSHDIRTPMNAIIGFIELLKQEADNPEQVLEYVQRIDAASQHLLGLINDVLDVNKIESGSATLNISELNLAEVIDEINTIIRPQTKAKDQVFDISVSSLTYEHLEGDKLRLNQILINLLSNAVKYTPEGGRIEIRVEELPQVVEEYSRVRFVISDNGLGMSEEYQKVIFDPFTREETSATRQIQGTGLGMAITKSLVDLMGGTIRVDSTLGAGSTFTVELEFRIQERENDVKFWAEHGVSRMIVADDEEDICRHVICSMKGTGVKVDYSTDGAVAIRMMREAREAGRPYDIILLDWKMPNLNGLETARLIRKNYSPKIPILLLTAYDWGEIEKEATDIGVSHFMPKPFFVSTFKDAIRRVMGNLTKDENDADDVVKGKKILVVDDIEVNQIILVKILSSLGASCEAVGDGQAAVEAFESAPPGTYDLILMDVQMPVMDGHEATRAIRAGAHPEAGTIPIIAMTANAFVDDVREAIKSGMNAHVSKPVQIDKLKEAIRQVLESREKQEPDAETERSVKE